MAPVRIARCERCTKWIPLDERQRIALHYCRHTRICEVGNLTTGEPSCPQCAADRQVTP